MRATSITSKEQNVAKNQSSIMPRGYFDLNVSVTPDNMCTKMLHMSSLSPYQYMRSYPGLPELHCKH